MAYLALLLTVPAVGCARAEFVPVLDAAADLAADVPEDAGEDARKSPDVATCPAPTIKACTPVTAAPCDPVCQTGNCDWCSQKCTYAYATEGAAPVTTCATTGTRKVGQSCTVLFAGTSQQRDDCTPASVCLTPVLGDEAQFCFALCRDRSDCPYGVDCGPRDLSAVGGSVNVCDPPYDQCGPDGTCCDPLADTGCGLGRYCLLVSPDSGSGHSRTVCEYAYGDGRDGLPCNSARDCQTRNTCVANACRAVCDDTHPCAGGKLCHALGSEYGYCL